MAEFGFDKPNLAEDRLVLFSLNIGWKFGSSMGL